MRSSSNRQCRWHGKIAHLFSCFVNLTHHERTISSDRTENVTVVFGKCEPVYEEFFKGGNWRFFFFMRERGSATCLALADGHTQLKTGFWVLHTLLFCEWRNFFSILSIPCWSKCGVDHWTICSLLHIVHSLEPSKFSSLRRNFIYNFPLVSPFHL